MELLQLCLSHMPLRDDQQEARLVHRQLANLMESYPTYLVGKRGSKTPNLLRAVAEIVKVPFLWVSCPFLFDCCPPSDGVHPSAAVGSWASRSMRVPTWIPTT